MSSEARVILVTGSNTGIGYELVLLLAEKKHTVYLSARNKVAGKEALEKLKSKGLNTVKFVQLDVTDRGSIESAKAHIEKEEGRLDVLVNNAAIAFIDQESAVATTPIANVRQAFDVNFFGVFETTQVFLPLLHKSSQPVIVNVSSEFASNTQYADLPDQKWLLAPYVTSKAALSSFTIMLARELKSAGFKVNAVTPGFTATRLNFYDPGGQSVRAGATALLPWTLLDKDGPTGQFLNKHGDNYAW